MANTDLSNLYGLGLADMMNARPGGVLRAQDLLDAQRRLLGSDQRAIDMQREVEMQRQRYYYEQLRRTYPDIDGHVRNVKQYTAELFGGIPKPRPSKPKPKSIDDCDNARDYLQATTDEWLKEVDLENHSPK